MMSTIQFVLHRSWPRCMMNNICSMLVVLSALLLHLFPQETRTEVVFVKHPQSQAVRLGSRVLLDCQVRDTFGLLTSFNYRWTLNGSNVSTKASSFRNHSLHIPLITTRDLGIYQCIVNVQGQPFPMYRSRRAMAVEAFLEPFVIMPQSSNVKLGDLVELECVSGRSAPMPIIYWTKDGEKIVTGRRYNASFGDSDPFGLVVQYSMKYEFVATRGSLGAYRCVAENFVARKREISKPGQLIVTMPFKSPHITVPLPREVIKAEGETLTLICPILAHPTPNITWEYRNALLNLSRVISRNKTLVISPLVRGHRGYYECYGNNSLGSIAATPTFVTVAYIEVAFVKHPSDVTTFSGRPVNLTCQPPTSEPPATVTWYRDNAPFIPRPHGEFPVMSKRRNDTWNLEFAAALILDAGIYYCIATNQYSVPTSRTSTPAELVVLGGAKITEPPIDTLIIKGKSLRLTCRVDGNPFPSVTWYRGDHLISASNRRLLVQSNQLLYISAVDKGDEGVYRCRATNIYTNVSASAFVDVIVPAMITNEIGQVVVVKGNDAVMSCEVAGEPTPIVTWLKDGRIVSIGGRISLLADGLHISQTVSSDAANYTCRAHNSGGVVAESGTLIVQVPPFFTKNLTDVIVSTNQSAVFTCSARGNPKPQLTWFYNETKSPPDGAIITADRLQLSITMVTHEHIGTYKCVAESHIGNASSTAALHIIEAPNIFTIYGDTVVGVSRNLFLTCVTSGLPPPSVTWYHNGQSINTTDGRTSFPTKNSVLIKFLTLYDEGNYTCDASNLAGAVNKTVFVRVFDVPRPPYLHSIEALSTTSVNISWTLSDQELLSPIKHVLIHYKPSYVPTPFVTYKSRIPPSLSSYELDGLLPQQRYTFVMTAVNLVGEGRHSNAMEATTFARAPPAPHDLSVRDLGTHHATLIWRLQPRPTTRYQIRYTCISDPLNHTYIDTPVTRLSASLHYTVSGLEPGKTYEMRVRAGVERGGITVWGEFSAPINVTTNDPAPTEVVRGVTTVHVSSRYISLKWAPVNDATATRYIVQTRSIAFTSLVHTLVIAAPNETSATVTGLLPWQWYNATVRAANREGAGPSGVGVVVMTLPEAPSSPPGNISVTPVSSSVVRVDWQAVPPLKANGPVAGYYVRYNAASNDTVHVTVAEGNTTSMHIGNLHAWTVYSVQVAAYSTSVENGTGPYSEPVTVTTLPSLPGRVRDITYVVTTDTANVSWNQPIAANGVILGYIVVYSLFVVDRFNARETVEIYVNETSSHLPALYPDSLYQVNVSVINTEGVGPSTSLVIRTLALTVVTTDPVLSSTMKMASNVSTYLQYSGSGVPPHKFPIIIAAALIIFIILVFIIAFLVYRFCKRRQQKRNLTYYSKQMIEDLQTIYNQDRYTIDHDVPQTSPHSRNTTHDHVTITPITSIDSPVHQTSPTSGPVTITPAVAADVRSIPHPDSPSLPRDTYTYSSHVTKGIENPVYDFDQSLPEMMSPDQVYSQFDTGRRMRMRSESAAAIAAGQNRSLHLVTGDKEALIDNDDSVVVYRERTAL